ncbi:MAG: hypothetical protein IKK53_07675 [Ruminiclostridium sp.]|nr:hypothetical protein [Ruminiclostridium sp.]
MAGFWVVMLPFLLMGMAAVTFAAVAAMVLALDWGISLAVIMGKERERQKRYGKKPVAETFMMIYGIVLAAVPTSIIAVLLLGSEDIGETLMGIAGIAIPFVGFSIPMGIAGSVLVQVFMLIAGISCIAIGCAERKRLKRRGEKHIIPVLMIIYGIIITAIPVGTAVFLGGGAWLINMLSEEAVFLM